MGTSGTFEFSSTRSYQLFQEGLDSLRAYEKGASSQELTAAEQSLRECVESYPADILPRFYFAVVRTLSGYSGLDEAIDQFNKVIASGSAELIPEAKYNLAVAYLGKYTSKDAQKAQDLLQEVRQAIGFRVSDVKWKTLDLQAQLIQAYLFVEQQLFKNRVHHPDSEDSVTARQAKQTLDDILVACNQSDLDASATHGLMADYYNALATYWESLAWSKQGAEREIMATRATELFGKALEEKPGWIDAKSNLARVYQELLGSPDKAMGLWDEVLTSRPEDDYANYMRGQIFELTGPKSLAVAAYRRAVSNIPEARLKLGLLLEKLHEDQEASVYLQRFLVSQDVRSELIVKAVAAINRIQSRIRVKATEPHQ